MKCWNCLKESSDKLHRCPHCDQPLKPNAAQSIASKRNLDYLLSEIDQWSFLDPSSKERVRQVYSRRQTRLGELAAKNAYAYWPISDWEEGGPITPEPLPENVDLSSQATLEVLPVLTPAEDVGEPTLDPVPTLEPAPIEESEALLLPKARPPALLESLVGEADIRWFHSLGALLVVAAVVGWLRSSWDSYGRALAGLLIAASPILLHLVAHKLKKTVPLSSRLLAILANVLTPPALLALDVFGGLPPGISSAYYWSFALLASAAILSWQADATQEKVPLYVGALCAVMAGWSQGALATACFSLGVGFLFSREGALAPSAWLEQRRQVAFYAGSFGALATLWLFETNSHPMLPLMAFTVALVFLHLPTLTGHAEQQQAGSRIFLQASLSIVGGIMMRAVLDLSPGGVALYLLFAAALFLAVKPDSDLASTSAKLASAIGILALVMGFLSDLGTVALAQQTAAEAGLRFLFAGLGAVFFARASRRAILEPDSQSLLGVALCCLLGGWIHIFLYFLLQEPIHNPVQFIPLLAAMPLFCCLLLLGSRWGRIAEQITVWKFAFPLTLGSLALTLLGRSIAQDSALGWELALLIHALFSIAWERAWIVKAPTEVTPILQILPRFAIASLTVAAYSALSLPVHSSLLLCCCALLLATFLLKGSYSESTWEAGWLSLWLMSFHYPDSSWFLGVALLSFGFALTRADRKKASLVSSCLFATFALTQVAGELAFYWLYTPCLAFALIAMLRAKGEAEGSPLAQGKVGFDILLAAAVLLGDTPSPGSLPNLILCLFLTALAGAFQPLAGKPPTNKFLSSHSALSLFGVIFLWSLWQTPLETGILLILAGLSSLALSHRHKWEVSNALLIVGMAQLPSSTHFLLDGVVVALAVIASEVFSSSSKRASTHFSNLALLLVASVQEQSFLWEGLTGNVIMLGALILTLRTAYQNFVPTAAGSALLFLWQLDQLIGGELLDLKLRLLPASAVLVAASLWRWQSEQAWTRPSLYAGMTLATAPAFLQFVSGLKLWENFVWTLIAGCGFLALSFITPSSLNRPFRQAGGYTLTAWAAVSLTRAALHLPWQAATLVIGLALVTIGVVVERRGRGGKASKFADPLDSDQSL